MGWLFDSVERIGGDGNNTQADGSSVHLALYKYDSCPFCVRVHTAIDRLDVKVEYRDVSKDRAHGAAHRARTGRGTVPCLYIDDEPLFESVDIVEYLRENFSPK